MTQSPILVSPSQTRVACPISALQPNFRGKKNNKHKQLRGIVLEMGGGQIVYVFPFSWGKKEHINRQEASITWCDLFWPKFGQKMPKSISLHDVLEPLKQALWASRDVIISSQICGSKLQKVFTLGDGCWLPNKQNSQEISGKGRDSPGTVPG